ncbi:Paxillin-like protein [Penicillium digitatum]|uniref:Paxillin-like protein n=1 Tax=Penicillium digitatum TaxID=36651 RepID=A0A7T7BHU5_PENDI|nr:Paxillin-like protein [Penicillium digitatum]
MDDTPPVPPAPLRTSKKNSVHRDSDVSVVPSPISKEEASGFDFGILRGQSPTSGPQALPEEPSSAQFQDQTQYVAFNPVHLHPVTEETEPGSDAPRKSSNASMTSVFSVTSFARALGLDDQMNSSESSGSDSSYSDARSGSSMSSLPSVASFNRYKPTDPLNLKHLAHTRQTVLEIPGHIRSSVEGVPHMPAALFSPDSPTDPSINRGGKSVSSSDGRLTGRYHRGCFVCFECHSPFQTADFYVLNNRPFCAQHYHERNGSLCAGCNTGIEGHYLETVERNPARPDRRRFHTHCLQCRTCHVLLKGDYFEWNGEVFCERDARRAAAASHPPPPGPPGRRRPNLPPSPLAQSGQFSPGPYPMPGGRLGPAHGPGLHPGSRFPTGGGGRFPERRTTRLMMI